MTDPDVEVHAKAGGNARGIDCDVHVSVPGIASLLPFLSEYWRDSTIDRGLPGFDSIAYPHNSPFSVNPEWRPAIPPYHAIGLEQLRLQLLDRTDISYAICNCLYGVQLIHSEDMAVAFSRALNDWIVAEWLDRDPRLRASIVVPMQNPEMAAEEIERCAGDLRFVQVLMLVMGDLTLGKRHYWPIYRTAQRLGLPVGIHAGSMYRNPSTGIGWPTYHAQDYFSNAAAFQTQLTSLICEGVFAKFPELTVVMVESGVTWLPAFLWRLDKYWHGLRVEVPWVDRRPSEIVASNVRFTLQPFDAPPDPDVTAKLLDHIGNEDLILYSSDYPHWQFNEGPIPKGMSTDLVNRIRYLNPLATYPRLRL